MEKRNLLLNYFIGKLVDYEKVHLNISDFRTAVLTLALAKHRERPLQPFIPEAEYYYFHTNYPQELLCLCCLESLSENGDYSLFKAFGFFPRAYSRGECCPFYVVDERLQSYLRFFVYKPVNKMSDVDWELYSRLMPDIPLTVKYIEDHWMLQGRLWDISIPQLEMPQPCLETELIDNAWKRMQNISFFPRLFDISQKYNYNQSILQEFFTTLQIFRDSYCYFNGNIRWCRENAIEYRQDYLKMREIF